MASENEPASTTESSPTSLPLSGRAPAWSVGMPSAPSSPLGTCASAASSADTSSPPWLKRCACAPHRLRSDAITRVVTSSSSAIHASMCCSGFTGRDSFSTPLLVRPGARCCKLERRRRRAAADGVSAARPTSGTPWPRGSTHTGTRIHTKAPLSGPSLATPASPLRDAATPRTTASRSPTEDAPNTSLRLCTSVAKGSNGSAVRRDVVSNPVPPNRTWICSSACRGGAVTPGTVGRGGARMRPEAGRTAARIHTALPSCASEEDDTRAGPTPALAARLEPDDVAVAGPDRPTAEGVDARVGGGALAAWANAADSPGRGKGAAALAEVPSASSATAACLMRA